MANNNMNPSSTSNHVPPINRKVHVVYYLSRSGQLEHPHLLEVSIPVNEGLYLRDVKKRLAIIRGTKLASTFSWSYKRNYKNVTVWQDLCDDDLIFPANGCEYVLKGSEILTENICRATAAADGTLPDKGCNSKDHLNNIGIVINPTSPIVPLKQTVSRTSDGNGAELLASVATNNLSECGTDAATQTDQDHATELNKIDINSPPSVASVSTAPSPYNNNNNIGISNRSSYNHSVGANSTTPLDHELPCQIDNNASYNNRPNLVANIGSITQEEDGAIASDKSNQVGQYGGKTTPARNAEINVLLSSPMTTKSEGSLMMKTEAMLSGHVKLSSTDPSAMSNVKGNGVGSSKGKHSGALSLLQLMSCGSLDIKDQVLPMALYQFRTNNNGGLSNDRLMCGEGLGYGSSSDGIKLWNGGSSLMYHEVQAGAVEYGSGLVNLSPGVNTTTARAGVQVIHKAPNSFRFDSSDGQQVMAGARASISDRSANGSRELAEVAENSGTTTGSIGEAGIAGPSNAVIATPPPPHPQQQQLQRSIYGKAMSAEISSCLYPTSTSNASKASSELVYKSVGTEPLNPNPNGLPARINPGMKKAVSGEIHSLSKFGGGVCGSASPMFLKQMLMNEQGAKSEHHHSSTQMYNNSDNSLKDHKINPPGSSSHQYYHHHHHNQKRASSMPSKAFSEGEVSCMVQINGQQQSKSPKHNHNHSSSNNISNNNNNSNINNSSSNGYDRSMAQLWEELLGSAPPKQQQQQQQDHHSNHNHRRQAMSAEMEMERERTLQNAVGLSLLPPLEHLLLQECPKKVKAEMKSHMKICSSPKSNSKSSDTNTSKQFHSAMNFRGKNSSNLCKRFFRHPPDENEMK